MGAEEIKQEVMEQQPVQQVSEPVAEDKEEDEEPALDLAKWQAGLKGPLFDAYREWYDQVMGVESPPKEDKPHMLAEKPRKDVAAAVKDENVVPKKEEQRQTRSRKVSAKPTVAK